jgi:hypothetical protein
MGPLLYMQSVVDQNVILQHDCSVKKYHKLNTDACNTNVCSPFLHKEHIRAEIMWTVSK